MYVAVLIGFQYSSDLRLPGIIIDLYAAYRFCRSAKAECFVLTDISEDEKTEYLSKAVFEGVVDAGVFSFIQQIRARKEYHHLNSRERLNFILDRIFEAKPPRLFIYFTGHGLTREGTEDSGLILPSREMFSFYQLRSRIMHLPPASEIIWVNDCCHVSGIQLPYKLSREGFYELTTGQFCPVQYLLFLGGTSVDEKSLVSREGSVFSSILFRKLLQAIDSRKARFRDVRVLLESIKERLETDPETRSQQPTVFSSHPNLFILGPWFFGQTAYLDPETTVAVLIEGRPSGIVIPSEAPFVPTPRQQPSEVVDPCWNEISSVKK